MSIFGIIKCDDKVFTGDKLRIDVSESFLAPGLSFGVISHEVSTDNGTTWYNISAKKSIDWIFMSAGAKTISLRINTTVPSTQTFTKSVTVIDLTTANLFSLDSDLYQYETDIDKYLPKKWSSWNLVSLAARDWIVDWLDEKRIFKENGEKYAASDLLDKQQVKQLSVYKTLQFIFESNSNIDGDIFSQKSAKYKELANTKASMSQLKLDYDDSGTDNGPEERTDMMTVQIRRG
jgi:hypothetical protein